MSAPLCGFLGSLRGSLMSHRGAGLPVGAARYALAARMLLQRGAQGRFEEGSELIFEGERAKPAEGEVLYLTSPFAGYPDLLTDLTQRRAPAAVEAVAAFDDVTLAFGELREKVVDGISESVLHE